MRNYIALLVLALLSLRCAAADPAPSPPNAQAITLAEVLPTVQPPAKGIALVVGADKDVLPDNSPAPPSGLSLADCADDFGLITQTFGSVQAIAPPTMVVFNNNPGPPDLAETLSPSVAFKQLAASLTDSQWKLLTSASGIGLSDLDDSQQPFFWAIFPGRSLKIVPKPTNGADASKEQATDLSSDLPQAHIRVAQKVDFFGDGPGGGFISSASINPVPGAPMQWMVAPTRKPPAKSLYGNLVRAEVDNQLKPSDLLYNSRALQTPIPLDGVKTVGDLVYRIGHATGLEIYADPHYAARTVTFLGSGKTAAARDLLQALALCVAGTYRAVGPAYVLTDDLVGIATTREIWEVYEERARHILSIGYDKTKAALYHQHGGDQIASFGDPLALSAKELAPDPSDPTRRFFPWMTGFWGRTLAELTPGQQHAAARAVANYNTAHAAEIAKNPDQAEDSNWKWSAMPHITAQALAPGFPQPIDLSNVGAFGLLDPPNDVQNKATEESDIWHKQNAQPLKRGDKPAPPVADLLKKTAHRALLAAPRSPDVVRSLVAAMQKLGLNELWLTVFADGQARIPNTPFPQQPDQKDDLLAAALAATKGTGIAVYPVASLLTWGHAPKVDLRDLNVLGEDSAIVTTRERQNAEDPILVPDADKPNKGTWVSPFAPEVTSSLSSLVEALGSRSGIGGLIWRATAPFGYFGEQNLIYGYTERARLGFLRTHHADPLDITGDSYAFADFSIPGWDSSQMEAKESDDWNSYRADADNRLLRSLYASARQATPPGAALTVFAQGSDVFGIGQPDFEGGPIPSAPLPSDGSLPTAKPDITLKTILLEPAYAPIGLATTLNQAMKDKSPGGFALDIIPVDGGMGAAGFADFAKKEGTMD